MDINKVNKIVINLPERKERLQSAIDEINYGFLNKFFYIQKGFIDTTPQLGIAQAHMSCIRRAKLSEWKNVLIMEDDIEFRIGSLRHMQKCFKHTPEDYDILLGGIYSGNDIVKPYSEYWNKTGNMFCGLHFYVVNEKAYDKLLSYSGTGHYDHFMSGLPLNCYTAKKMFAMQRNGYSDNNKREYDYMQILEAAKAELL